MNVLAIVKKWKLDEKEMIGKISLILWDKDEGKQKQKKCKNCEKKNSLLF